MKVIVFIVMGLCMAVGVQAQQLAFYNVNIVDVEGGRIIPGMTVEIRGGVIVKISKAAKRVKKKQIDQSGVYLMPGMIDSHSHWGNFGVTPEFMQSMTDSYLEAGVTTVRDAGGDERIVKQYKDQMDSGKIVGPSVYMSSFWTGPAYPGGRQETRGYPTENAPWSQKIKANMSPEELEHLILEAKEYGCTGLKLYNDISYETLKRIVPLCHKHGVKPWGHFATLPATAIEVVKAGVEVVSHSYLIDGISGHEPEVIARRFSAEGIASRNSLYQEMIRRGTILDATVKVCVESGIPVNTLYTREAYRAGVKIAAGTDLVIPEEDGKLKCLFLDELNLLADSCGMSIPDVLRAATIVGAEVVGQTGKLGIIREGAEADLLFLKSNPLESLTALQNWKALYIDGKEVKFLRGKE